MVFYFFTIDIIPIQILSLVSLLAVSRELTKLFEETKRGTVTEVITYFTNNILKGEIVVVVDGKK